MAKMPETDGRAGATRIFRLLALAVTVVLFLGASAHAQEVTVPQDAVPSSIPRGIEVDGELPERPDGYELTARDALAIAARDEKVAETLDRWGGLTAIASAEPGSVWQIGFVAEDGERAQVMVDGVQGVVTESWTGHQVAWQMARGYEGSFGHRLNAAYVWIPLAAIFFLGLFDLRRPMRLVHLDLLVLLSFSISHIFFNDANIGVSVPLVYPALLYLLARMLMIGFRGGGAGLRPSTPLVVLTIATCFLIGFRIALNVADSGVIDVGYAGVIGADNITHGEAIYGEFPDDNPTGDTYGPPNYYAYVPFELAFPWSGTWDSLPAGHAAAIFFDLLTVCLLFFLGRRLRPGPQANRLGVILAFAWAAYPYTAFTLQSNSNDSLIAALIVGSLLAIASPAGRGALIALAGLAKFAPLALVPLLAAGDHAGLASPDPDSGEPPRARRRVRQLALFALGVAGATALVMLPTVIDPGLSTFWERSISSQIDRESPFSIWGQVSGLDWLQTAVRVGVIALAVLVAFFPRRRSLLQVCALAAAVMIAIQLTADHWFYLYIVWFAPLVFAASSGRADGSSPPVAPPRRPDEVASRPARPAKRAVAAARR